MKARKPTAESLYLYIYIAAVAALIIAAAASAVPLSAGTLSAGQAEEGDFSDGWLTETGERVTLDDVDTKNFGDSVVLEKTLPAVLAEDDALCFQTKNADVTVWVDGKEVYRFESRENLTGKGYGLAYHCAGLSSAAAGRTVRILLRGVLSGHEGRIWRTYLCPGVRYVQLCTTEKLLSIRLSMLIIFFGLLLFAFHFFIPDKEAMPFDAAALGAAVLALGMWSLIDTGLPLLLSGQVYVSRVTEKLLFFFVGYPLVCFADSLAPRKRIVFRHIVFWASVLSVAVLLVLRYCFGGDMIYLYLPVFSAYAGVVMVLLVIIGMENTRYYRQHKRDRTGLRVNLALGILSACASVDVVIYITGPAASAVHGAFLRFGLVVFSTMMLFQFLRWWAAEHAAVERNRFINRALQYAVSGGEPEESIRALLKYLGTELHARRTYIFEEQGNGTWHGTYEWFAEGMAPRKPELLDLPYEGLIDKLYPVFKRDNHLIIPDREQCRDLNPILYETLRVNQVERFVAGPLEMNGRLLGLFGVDDAPRAKLKEISEIIRLISFFFAQLVMQRDEQTRLLRYSYYDALTGVHNRRAFTELVEKDWKAEAGFGCVMCDVNGLKAENDKFGHEAGDRVIIDVAKSLAEVFGEPNVYRLGGDEFAAIGFEADEAAFAADLERVKARIAEAGRSASVGAVYCADGTRNVGELITEADARMYQTKELYYQGRHDRRRR